MIYTIEAKDNILFPLLQKHFGLGSAEMNKEINLQHEILVQVLKDKGIDYTGLKNALIPSKDRKEALLVFDSSRIDNCFYGGVVMEMVVKCLGDLKTHSILAGDFIDIINDSSYDVLTLMKDHIELPENTKYCNEFFLVYINNLSNNQFAYVQSYYDNLMYFVGCVDLTYSSNLKDYCSYILKTSFIKYKNIIISTHEDDRDISEDINIHDYPFEKNGYIIRSLPEYLFGVFLNYKIESTVTGADIGDIGISIQSISWVR